MPPWPSLPPSSSGCDQRVLTLKADGTFQYWLTVGSLDEVAKGSWTASGSRIKLVNDHPVKAPTITAGTTTKDPGVNLKLKVVTASGEGIPGVDLTIGLADGTMEEGYTQTSGWDLPAGQKSEPRWVMFSMDSYGLRSPRFPIDLRAANSFIYVLTPNDIGVVDASTMAVNADRDGLTVTREGQPMHFKPRAD